MIEVEFSELVDVSPRQAWPLEAQNFTPWLAKNLDRLGKALGMALELEQAEAAVGPFAADILARDSRDGAAVLIENQLAGSDHTHLGQIMTYLTGLDAKTVIWVAPEFRQEHLSALRWLNENTVEPFSFFAVRVRVVKISNSPYAPLFEVVERPNNWDRHLQRLKVEADAAKPETILRRAFWDCYIERFPVPATTQGSATSRWQSISGLDLVVSLWLSKDKVGVFVRGGRGADGPAIAGRLKVFEGALQEKLGAPLGNTTFPFAKELQTLLAEQSQWDNAMKWLHTEANLYASALTSIFDGSANKTLETET